MRKTKEIKEQVTNVNEITSILRMLETYYGSHVYECIKENCTGGLIKSVYRIGGVGDLVEVDGSKYEIDKIKNTIRFVK